MNIRPIGFVDRSMLEAGFFWKFKSRLIRLNEYVSVISLRDAGEDAPIVTEWKAADGILKRLKGAMAPMFGGTPGDIVHARIEVLSPGGFLPWRADEMDDTEDLYRLHLCITPSECSLEYSGAEVRAIPSGELCYVNNRVLHSSVNHGTHVRVHLIIDGRVS